MKRFLIQRLQSDDAATRGQILDDEMRELAKTFELPWRDNAPDVSCIPPGVYPCHRTVHHPGTSHAYEVFELDGVPGREHVQIHIGNTAHDTEGCIIVGLSYGEIDGSPAILESKDGFARFMNALAGEQNFVLAINNPTEIAA